MSILYLSISVQMLICYVNCQTFVKQESCDMCLLFTGEIQSCRKPQMYRITSEWHWTLNCQKYPVYTEYLPLRPKYFHSLCCTTSHFWDVRLQKFGKCTEWPQNDLKHLTVESTLYTLDTYPWGPNFVRFTLQPVVFEIQSCYKLEMHQITSEWPWTLPKVHCIRTLNTYPRGRNFNPFCCTTSHFRDTRLQKMGNARNDLRMTLNTSLSKFPICIECLSLRPKFHSVSL